MKITYEFDTDADSWADDRYTVERYNKSEDLLMALWDFSQQLRSWYKRDERDAIPQEEISKKFYDILEDHGIDLDKLVY